MTVEFNLEIFESDAKQSGTTRYWIAHEFMCRLGYETWSAFKQVINKAIGSCVELKLNITESFIPFTCEDENGNPFESYKLTRFACFLITMHADSRKPQVSKAKAVLSAIADIALELEQLDLQRIEARSELKVGEKIMTDAAFEHGVRSNQLGIFKDAGFRGMYNMSLHELKNYKKMPDKRKSAVLYDYMNVTELAANSFRTTQTAEKIRSTNTKGLSNVQEIARKVAKNVRDIMISNSNIKPEDIPLEEDINEVKKELRKTHREMIKIDKIEK